MKKIVYSPDYREKIEVIREWLDLRFGKIIRTKHLAEIRHRLVSLKEFPTQGMSVRAMFGVDSDYEFIYVSHNYIFYYQDEDVIYIVNIYDDREDFMYKLFGIRTTSVETDQ
jgi:plasmid stabilization system protein ParE